MLFGDLVGFTNTSDGADPEDVRARVRPFHDLVRREVAKTGGTVARVVGDGVMVVWGYPTAREDDATRAIRAALGIRRGIVDLDSDMHARIGINSGEAVVAFGSADERADDAMGDSVNVAARLASSAPIDGIVVGEATATLAGSVLEAQPLGPLSLKGKTDPVLAFLVLGLAGLVDPAAAQPFVGRSQELAALRDALDRAERNRGVVRALITGEPGIGKSRLVAELRNEQRTGRPAIWLVGRCRAEGGAPLWSLGEIVKAWASISDDDSPATALEKVDASLPNAIRDRSWVRDRIAQLAGSGTGAPPSADEVGLVLASFLEAIAGQRTVVVQIDDVHWADDELIDVLTGAGLATAKTPVLLLLTARPELLQALRPLTTEGDVHLSLTALTPDDGDALIAQLASAIDLAPEDRAAVVARSGGNPLFAGELVRLLIQGGPDRAHIGRTLLPETVQAVIAARLDLLSPPTRDVARDAAVVGDSFWHGSVDALASVGGASSRVREALHEPLEALVRLEFIRHRRDSTLPGDEEYAFRHVLVRDVAYGQLTRADRAIRHAAAAQWLAARAGPERDDLAGSIADHDLRAIELAGAADGRPDIAAARDHAFEYLMRAGRHALGVDVRAAIARFRVAADVAPTPRACLAALQRLAAAGADLGDYVDAIATADEGERLAKELGAAEALGDLWLSRARARRPLGDAGWAADVRAAIELLETIDPTVALVNAYALQTHVEMTEGSGADLLVWADKAMATAEQLGVAPPAAALGRRGFARAMLGDRGGEADLQRAVEIARATGDSVALANAVSDLGGAYAYRGDTPAVEACIRESITIARTRGLRGIETAGLANLGHVHAVQGRYDEALAALDEARGVAVPDQDRVRPFVIDCERALALESRGEFEAAEALRPAIVAGLPGEVWLDLLATLEMLWTARRGDPAGLRDAFSRVYLQEVEGDLDAAAAINYPPIARAAISVGATEVVARILPTIARRSAVGAAIHDTLEGLLLASSEREGMALEPLARSIAFWDEAGFRPEAAQARQALATALTTLGRTDDAAALLEAAAAAWVAMDAPVREADCARQLAKLRSIPGSMR